MTDTENRMASANIESEVKNGQTQLIGFMIFVTIVTLLTWTLGLVDFKYREHSVAAFSDGFPGDLALWERAGDWSNVEFKEDRISIIRNTSNRSYAKRTFYIDPTIDRSTSAIRITGTLEAENTKYDGPSEQGGSYMVWLNTADGDVARYLTIQELRDSVNTYDAERIVSIPQMVTSFTLVLNSRETKHVFSLVDASAAILTINENYTYSTYLIVLLWICIALACLYWLAIRATLSMFIIASFPLAAIVVGVILPDTFMTGVVDPFVLKFVSISTFSNNTTLEIVYKSGHFIFFFMVAFVLFLSASRLSISHTPLAILLGLFAIASEGMQLHLLDRNTRLFDLGVDISGIVLAWLLASLILNSKKAE